MAPAPDSRPTAPAADEALAAPRRGFVGAGWAKFSDNAIPSLVVTVIVGLVIFSLNETSDRITRLKDGIDTRFTAVDARFTKLEDDIDARFTKLEESQHEIALTLARLVALFEAHDEAETTHRASEAAESR